jgi:4-amino-4-deoxy-L-arabinose transferase-like glycosyltransferase
MRWLTEQPIRLAIVIGTMAVAVRLVAIDQPFVDHWSWRQSDVAAIARNYFTGGFHFACPQIDWAGDEPGYVGTEFPLLPFTAACLYKIFGVHDWIGRSLAVTAFTISLPFFFLLVRDTCAAAADNPARASVAARCHVAATWALFFYGFAPLAIMTSRCFMPDMASLGLCVAGLYGFARWTRKEESTGWLGFSAICISLAILLKATSAIIGLPLVWMAFERQRTSVFSKPSLWIYGIVALVPPVLWYWQAHVTAVRFYPHHFFGAGGIRLEAFAWYADLLRRTAMDSLTPVLSALAIAGWFVRPVPRRLSLFHVWLGAMLIFIVGVGYGNRHPWYQLPLVPIAAAFGGAAVAAAPVKLRLVGSTLVAVGFLILSCAYVEPLYRSSAADLRQAGLAVMSLTNPGALIIVADYGDPTLFYYAQRKGWHFTERDGIYNGHPNSSADAIADLEILRRRGATHIVFYSGSLWWLDYYTELAEHVQQTTTVLASTPQFKIFAFNPAATDTH